MSHKNYLYQAYQFSERGYDFIRLTVTPANANGLGFSDTSVELNWQSGRSSGQPHPFYGGSIELSAGSTITLEAKIKLARKLTKVAFWDLNDEFVTHLEKLAEPAAYDSRVHRLVTKDELLPDSIRRYVDDLSPSTCTYGALTETPEQARQQIVAQAIERNDLEFVRAFAAAGMPIRHTKEYGPKAIPSLREVIITGGREL